MATVPKPDAAPEPEPRFGEATYTGETVRMTPEEAKARRRRSMWLALALIGFVVLVFTLTMTKMGAQIMVRDL